MLAKRRLSRSEADDARPAKRPRPAASAPPRDVVSTLSDELLVRILSFLDVRELLGMSPVSRRFHRVAADSQLWCPLYYRRFVLFRAHRLPGFLKWVPFRHWANRERVRVRHDAPEPGGAAPGGVDWKKQFRLRLNWARGRCAVGEVPVHDAERRPAPQRPTLVKVVDGLAVTADGEPDLRAWDLRTRRLVAQAGLGPVKPTCLAVDDGPLASGVLGVAAGFEDGTFGVWRLDARQGRLALAHWQAKAYLGELVAIAYGHPYVLTATRLGFISLYTFDAPTDEGPLPSPRQLTSLKSHSTRLPLALLIRRMAASAVASIAYTFDTVGGWAIGIQDLDIGPSGRAQPDVVRSRVAYTVPTQTRGPATPSPGSPSPGCGAGGGGGGDGPTRLRYSHPYLLASLGDNTMVLHLCTSTATALSISAGTRLWGHTSGISDAEITPRGKAVSVSTRGDEIRLWELEGRVGGSSVEVRPRQPGGDADAGRDSEDRKKCVGFDDEMVVVLKEARDGRDSLVVYDFT